VKRLKISYVKNGKILRKPKRFKEIILRVGIMEMILGKIIKIRKMCLMQLAVRLKKYQLLIMIPVKFLNLNF
jgi:hypothetical protein